MSASLARLAAATGIGIGLAGGCAYAALSARSQLFGPTLIAGHDVRQVALTFDDGPNDRYTQRLLEVLDRHQVRATFFMIGQFVRQRQAIVRAVRAAGHLIGNHTMTHPWLVLQSPAGVRRELAGCTAALEDVLGESAQYFRPPHGARRPDVLRASRDLGLTPVMWNVMGYDWKPENDAGRILSYVGEGVNRNLRAGTSSNIVLHDGGHTSLSQDRAATIDAVSRYIPAAQRRGSVFVTVAQLSR